MVNVMLCPIMTRFSSFDIQVMFFYKSVVHTELTCPSSGKEFFMTFPLLLTIERKIASGFTTRPNIAQVLGTLLFSFSFDN